MEQEKNTNGAKDDALFEALGKSRKQRRRRILLTVGITLLTLAVVLVVGVAALRRQVREKFASLDTEVLSYTVSRGTISSVVSGSGTLSNVDAQELTVPEGVEVTETLVEYGDIVKEGDLLALVEMATVRSAMTDVQDEIKSLDKQLASAKEDTVSSGVTAGVSGRVKTLYGEVGDKVTDLMVEHGALAVISLDGHMAVEVETDQLAKADSVTVTLSNGQTVDGRVDSLLAGTATILLTDDGPAVGEEVTISREGQTLGTGSLYIHTPLPVTGYAGTISRVNVKENDKVSSSMYIYTLSDTTTDADYNALLRTRQEKEDTLLELLQLQKYGGLTAPIDGSVFFVADLDDDTQELEEIVTLSPDKSMSVVISVDESDILSLKLDQQAEVTVSSVSEDVLSGVVTEIDKTASDGAYTAEITLDKVTGMLPGMTAEVDIRIEGVENALIIPVDALHKTAGGAFVYTTYDEETKQYGGRVDVVTGLSNDDYVEITSGLSEGDTVRYTETVEFFFFGGMGNMGGGMPSGGNMGGGQKPNRSSGSAMPAMPAGGGMSAPRG